MDQQKLDNNKDKPLSSKSPEQVSLELAIKQRLEEGSVDDVLVLLQEGNSKNLLTTDYIKDHLSKTISEAATISMNKFIEKSDKYGASLYLVRLQDIPTEYWIPGTLHSLSMAVSQIKQTLDPTGTLPEVRIERL